MKTMLRNPQIPVRARELAILKDEAKRQKWLKPYLEHLYVPNGHQRKARK